MARSETPEPNADAHPVTPRWDRLRWQSLAEHQSLPLVLACVWLIGLGAYFRTHDFSYPHTLLFDEHHFVENARNYLGERRDWNDHPPLGKLVIAFAIEQLGDGPVAWRLPALAYGTITVLAGALAAARLFRSRAAGWITAAFLSADGFLIAYSRIGLLDGALATAAASVLLVASSRSVWVVSVVGGLVTGVGMSYKYSGVAAIAPIVVALILLLPRWRPRLLWTLTAASVAVITYVALFALGLGIAGKDPSIAVVLSETKRLYTHHVVLTEMKHPLTSGWPTWFVPVRPLVLGLRSELGNIRALSALGNLALWWAACGVALLCTIAVLRQGLLATLRPRTDSTPSWPLEAFVLAHGRAVVLAVVGAAAFVSPWVLTHRDSYIYHFLPAYAALVVLLGGYVGTLWPARSRAVLGYVAIVTVVAGWYGPVWSFLPLSHQSYEQRLPVETWR